MVKKIRKKKQVRFYSKKGDLERTDYDDGTRTLSMSPELEDAFQEQRQRFIEKFGREPNDDDPIFFDPDADTPQPYPEENENFEKCDILNVSYKGMGVKFYALEKIETCSKIHLEIVSKRQLTPINVTGTLRWIGGGGLMPFVGGLELTESLENLQLIKLF